MRTILILSILLYATNCRADAPATGIAAEQYLIYLINRARSDPSTYQNDFSIPEDLTDIPPQPPLAVNDLLMEATRFKSNDMANTDIIDGGGQAVPLYLEHWNPYNDKGPHEIIREAGYALPPIFPTGQNWTESLAGGWVLPVEESLRLLVIDEGVVPPSHRHHIFSIGGNGPSLHKEIGIGTAYDPDWQWYFYTLHTAFQQRDDVFLTGVAYRDGNRNQRYDLGEGLGGVNIGNGLTSTLSNAAGGWSIQVEQGTFELTASGGGFVGTSTVQLGVADENVHVEFLSGVEVPIVSFGKPFDSGAPVSPPQPTENPVLADFNGDSKADLVWQHTDGTIAAWFMDGLSLTGGALFSPSSPGDIDWRIVGNADFNGDSKPDLIWQHTDGSIAGWFMDGVNLAGGALFNPSTPGDRNWRVVSSGDFNGDYKPDLVWQHTDGSIAAWLMDGLNLTDGALFNPSAPSDMNWRIVGSGDFNGDSKPDLVWQHADGSLAAWFMDGVNLTAGSLFNPSGPGDAKWRIVGVGDYNGDSKPDLVWQHADGSIAIWFMDGINQIGGGLTKPTRSSDTGWKIVGP